ncbi:hypothetical protein ABZ926_08620 [Streptomyces litmocidini]|uniref:hypothetical protein n=1 Tax=Streptomyces litmocidini TaxID=67318 RepID=UPI0033E02896
MQYEFGGNMKRARHRVPAAVLNAAVILALAVSGLLADGSPARADIFGWYVCHDIPQVDVNLLSRRYMTRPVGHATGIFNSTDQTGTHKISYTEEYTVETETSVSGSVEANSVVAATLGAGWTQTVINKTATLNEESYPVPPHSGLYAQPYVRYLVVNYSRFGPPEVAYFGGAFWCKRSPDVSKAWAIIPMKSWVCIFTGKPEDSECPPEGRGGGVEVPLQAGRQERLPGLSP